MLHDYYSSTIGCDYCCLQIGCILTGGQNSANVNEFKDYDSTLPTESATCVQGKFGLSVRVNESFPPHIQCSAKQLSDREWDFVNSFSLYTHSK